MTYKQQACCAVWSNDIRHKPKVITHQYCIRHGHPSDWTIMRLCKQDQACAYICTSMWRVISNIYCHKGIYKKRISLRPLNMPIVYSKVHPRKGHEGARWGGWSMPWSLYPQERPGTHCIGGWTGRVQKISPLLGSDPWTVQTIASCHTNSAIHAPHSLQQVQLLFTLYEKCGCWQGRFSHTASSVETNWRKTSYQ